jgi:hypothetical protein
MFVFGLIVLVVVLYNQTRLSIAAASRAAKTNTKTYPAQVTLTQLSITEAGCETQKHTKTRAAQVGFNKHRLT